MRVVVFCHSILSDWNHGNAHFLRGLGAELQARGHQVVYHEAADAWSVRNLVEEHGELPIAELKIHYPELVAVRHAGEIDVDAALDGADLVLVHEWNEPDLVAAIGRARSRGGRFLLFFHDTHHRSVTRPDEIGRYELSGYDGVLAFGERVREVYVRRGWGRRTFTWHEAADVRVFRPLPAAAKEGDLIWIGNWGDGERTLELREFLLDPVRSLGVAACVHGVRYPGSARRMLADRGIRYRGWLPNVRVPERFGAYRATVHVPRRPYATALPGIPTIRVFEALACRIPLVSGPWEDVEGLFTPGEDFLVAADGRQMEARLRDVLGDPDLADAIAEKGRRTVLDRHTCAHRVDELLAICRTVAGATELGPPARTAGTMNV